MKYILYNQSSSGGKTLKVLEKLKTILDGEIKEISIFDIDLKEFVSSLNEEDEIVILGGDGTLNSFVNKIDDKIPSNNIYLFPSGSGNDFAKDITAKEDELILINEYIKDLPFVLVNGLKRYFFNGVGVGLDGYVCATGEDIRKKKNKKVGYTGIALKAILWAFKTSRATIEIDGNVYEHEYVWMAPTMKGRYFGGGMMIAPNQDRNKKDTLTNVIVKCKSRLGILFLFPTIFKGKHVDHTDKVIVNTGRKFKVTFEKPTALQVDGEVIRDVTTYEVDLDAK